MTNREFYTKVMEIMEQCADFEKLATNPIRDEIYSHAEAEIAKLDKRNENRSSKPNKKQLENEPIKVEIMEYLAEHGAAVSATIAAALSTEERPISTNKVVALCNQLVKEEKLVAEDVKIPKVGLRKQYAVAPASEG